MGAESIPIPWLSTDSSPLCTELKLIPEIPNKRGTEGGGDPCPGLREELKLPRIRWLPQNSWSRRRRSAAAPAAAHNSFPVPREASLAQCRELCRVQAPQTRPAFTQRGRGNIPHGNTLRGSPLHGISSLWDWRSRGFPWPPIRRFRNEDLALLRSRTLSLRVILSSHPSSHPCNPFAPPVKTLGKARSERLEATPSSKGGDP